MGYREPSPPEPTTIPYGHFRTSRGDSLLALFLFGLVLLAVGFSLSTWTFRCERDGDGAVRCEEIRSTAGFRERRRAFQGEQLGSPRWVAIHAGRQDEGRTELLDGRGGSAEVLRGPHDDARRWHQQLIRFLEDGSDRELVIDHGRSWAGLASAGLLFLWILFIVRSLVRTSGHYEVEVDEARGRIVVRAKRLGGFRSEIAHPLDGLSRIEVVHGLLARHHHGRGKKGEPAARLRLEYDDELRHLTPTQLPGSEPHEDLAERLREATGLAPELRPVAVGDAGSETGASTGSKKKSPWKQLAIGGALPVLAIGLAFVFIAIDEAGGEQVHLRSEQRCRFQGTELLPGGEMSVSLEPGEYVVKVFDPERVGQWRTDIFEVRRGEDTSYVCR